MRLSSCNTDKFQFVEQIKTTADLQVCGCFVSYSRLFLVNFKSSKKVVKLQNIFARRGIWWHRLASLFIAVADEQNFYHIITDYILSYEKNVFNQ